MNEFVRLESGEALQKFKSYPAYKHSGIEWLGQIPVHWEPRRLRHAASKIGSGKTPRGGAEVYVSEGIMLLRSQNVHFAGLRLEDVAFVDSQTDLDMAGSSVREGDVLLNITGASLGRCCVARLDGKAANVNQHVCIIRPRISDFNSDFLGAAIASSSVQAQIFNTENGISRDALNFDQIGQLSIVCPPLTEQRAIAAFLHRETAKIDALVTKKERVIELLQEKRTTLITRAVTKGLDPNAPMKDSCVEWLGEIPANWDMKPLKRAVTFIEGPGILAADFVDDGVPLLRISGISDRVASLTGCDYLSPGLVDQRWAHFRVRIGDLLISGSASTGLCAEVDHVSAGAIPYTGIIIIRPCFDVTVKEFLRWFFLSAEFMIQAKDASTGSAIQHFGPTHLSRMTLALPPLSEQRAIATFLDQETAAIDALIAKVASAIEHLKELSTALISSAVMGKIDVREEAA